MTRFFLLAAILLSAPGVMNCQWEIQDSHTSANLRGIHSVDVSVAWASGASGTVLRTVNGTLWEKCAVPPNGDQLDFRGIWAWDANNAMIMSAGPGEQSRIYKTTDGCAHWTEEVRNHEKDGFWDAVVFQEQEYGLRGDQKTGVLIGDPIHGRFDAEVTQSGQGWFSDGDVCAARPDEAAFAASNSSVFVFGPHRYIIGTGGKGGPRVLTSPLLAFRDGNKGCREAAVPLAGGTDTSGVFSIVFRDLKHGLAAGGDYKKPSDPQERRPGPLMADGIGRLRPGRRTGIAPAWRGSQTSRPGSPLEPTGPTSPVTMARPGSPSTMAIGTRCRCPTLLGRAGGSGDCERMRSSPKVESSRRSRRSPFATLDKSRGFVSQS